MLIGAGYRFQGCDYPLCGAELHTTTTCPVLHHRCTVCGYRGHLEPAELRARPGGAEIVDEGRFCDGANADTFEALRVVFEAHADAGQLTRYRRFYGGLGFYPEPQFPLIGYKTEDYDRLMTLPVLVASAIASGRNRLSYSTKKEE